VDKAALVNIDIGRGAEVIDILDRAKLKVTVAMWAHLAEYEDWRLVIAARGFDELELRAAFRLLHDTLRAEGMGSERSPVMMIFATTNPFIKALRRTVGKSKSIEGRRLGGQMVGDRFIEDAFVYRIS
jgi:hypothetical protein